MWIKLRYIFEFFYDFVWCPLITGSFGVPACGPGSLYVYNLLTYYFFAIIYWRCDDPSFIPIERSDFIDPQTSAFPEDYRYGSEFAKQYNRYIYKSNDVVKPPYMKPMPEKHHFVVGAATFILRAIAFTIRVTMNGR